MKGMSVHIRDEQEAPRPKAYGKSDQLIFFIE